MMQTQSVKELEAVAPLFTLRNSLLMDAWNSVLRCVGPSLVALRDVVVLGDHELALVAAGAHSEAVRVTTLPSFLSHHTFWPLATKLWRVHQWLGLYGVGAAGEGGGGSRQKPLDQSEWVVLVASPTMTVVTGNLSVAQPA